ncbi:hypothetical protein [Herbiconiux daphne]|uniref:Uncharacterized protein n=1 Tax=Herbiconiux daphne TaxID=2970914 RepID=A0ABT2H9G0_9MICO|nr:hypothetical protein [Herbiconiux daphne]MCS5736581.1 hypothetical protein [Herbiconiux daphne]
MDKDNKGLISDLSKSYARQGADQRYEGGGQADIYDRINSMEYALYFVRGELRNDIPAGDVQDYLGDENDKRTT